MLFSPKMIRLFSENHALIDAEGDKTIQGPPPFFTRPFQDRGVTVIEVKVNHRPRINGNSKYTNLQRGIDGLRDLMVVRWMISHSVKQIIGKANCKIESCSSGTVSFENTIIPAR